MGRLERVREVRERLLSGGTVVTPDGERRELTPIAVGPAEGAALRDWVRREGARRTLEVGLGFAISALFVCEGLLENGGDVRHVAVDAYQFESLPGHRTLYGGVGVAILEEAGVRDLVELHVERSETALPRLLAEGRTFDLAFVDGNHRFEGVFLDLVYCGKLLEPGSVVFADDMQLTSVRRATGFCVSNLGWRVEDEGREGGHQWVVLRTGSPDAFHRPFDRFVDF
ncbi:MAG: class I SAM-dependent methyltransferase [Gaiellaceae bacterium]